MTPTQPKQAIAPGYLDLKALAAYSSCSIRWLRARLVETACPLPHYRIQGKLLVKPGEFDRWIAAYRVASRSDEVGQIVDDVIAQVCRRTLP